MPRIVIYKSERRLALFSDSQEGEQEGDSEVCFRIGLGQHPAGHKFQEGDGRTPEGEYCVCTRNEKSKYHLSLGLSYPNERDAARALNEGAIDKAQYGCIRSAIMGGKRPPWDTPLGGFIMIHGGGASDWTMGCIALENSDMDILWDNCPIGTRVTVRP